MEDKRKTKSQLIRELVELRQQVSALEASKIECDQAKTESERARKYTDSILDTLREPLQYLVWLLTICNLMPPVLPPIMGLPFHIASVTVSPKPSRTDFWSTTSAAHAARHE